ncbi:MAG: serine/threonine protein kinase [Gemmataceae bacterium]|nr:serine/threonine protein kinase [Gemmataceae bacterium]MDW8264122.1 serine/threonine-protein kinase [Gemmataceae bacterium]
MTQAVAGTPLQRAFALQRVASDLGRRYQVLDYIGRGATATVWKVRDRITDEFLAVKRFEVTSVSSAGFYRELRMLFRLQHPRIVRVINLLEPAGTARYLLLEYCGGGSLRDAMQTKRSWTWEEAADLASQIAEGLNEAHRQGLVHRDLKPENVLFAGPGCDGKGVKLADFGLARALQQARALAPASAGGLSGTPIYMAPELFAGSFHTASDIYALGVIVYELLHGRAPFAGTAEELAAQHLHAPPRLRPDLPAPGRDLLAAMLAKRPAERPTAAALLAGRPQAAAAPPG